MVDSKITTFDQNLDRVTGAQLTAAENSVKSELRGEILSDSAVTTIVNSEITAFESRVNLGGTYATISTTNTLSGRIEATESDLTTIQEAGYVLTSEVDNVVATSTNLLTQRVTTVEGQVSTIEQQYTVGLDNNGTFTGFEIINGNDVNTFTVTSDDFKIKTDGGSKTPFAVSGNTVSLSDVQVTGNLNVGTGQANSMKLVDDNITIYDGSGNPRVIIGNLS